MSRVTYQTIKLSRGRHASPREGACVMELASMIAREPFSARPHSVSPSIAAFLRAYNDLVDDERRSDLYAYAAKSVGTAAPESVEVFRTSRLVAWGNAMRCRHALSRRIFGALRGRALARRSMSCEGAGRYAARSIRRSDDASHAAALALVDDLIGMGAGGGPWALAEAWPSAVPPALA